MIQNVCCAAFAVLFIYGLLSDNGVIRTITPVPVKLSIRKFKNFPSTSHIPGANIFMTEFNDMFLALVHILDYAVMKYVGDDVKLLVEQEHQHAKMHLAGQKEEEIIGHGFTRFAPLDFIFRRLFLRMGRTLGLTLSLGLETSSSAGFSVLFCMPFCGYGTQLTDVTVFHMYEEVEHGVVTVAQLRPQTNFIVRVICFPVTVALWVAFVSVPVITRTLPRPMTLLNPMTYVDMAMYLLTMVPVVMAGIAFLIMHYVPPSYSLAVGETPGMRSAMWAPIRDEMEKREGLEYEIIDSKEYMVNM